MSRSSALIRSSLTLALAACGSDGTPPPTQPLATSGSFTGTLTAGGSATTTFTAPRAGTINVGVCGPGGTNFDVTAGGNNGATSSNCERVVFVATAGQTVTVEVRATSGSGAFNGCWAAGTVECAVTAPEPARPPADIPDTSVYAAAKGKSGLALLQTLHDITKANHRFLDYTRARDSLYDFVEDPDNDDRFEDVYVGRTVTVNSRATANNAGINAEHSWPQSCGASTDLRSGTDLHILMPADAAANTQRSNFPFGVVTGAVQWTSPEVAGRPSDRSRLGADASGRTVFEPRPTRRGDVARALLYWYTRYYADRSATSGFELTNFNVEEATLIQWSQQDPPDAFERARNALVQRAQGNRNPFVDYPGLVLSVGDWPNEGAEGPRCSNP